MRTIDITKASAGSGKTHFLMEQFGNLVRNGNTSPENLMATTFTVKAAANLQSEIRRKLVADGHTDLAAKVFDGLIGTVNSVCGQLLAEYAVDAGFSPSMAVIPEEEANIIFNAGTEAVIRKYATKLERLVKSLGLNPLSQTEHNKSEDWLDDVQRIAQLARSNDISSGQLKEMAEKSCSSIKKFFPANNNVTLESIRQVIEPYANMEFDKLAKEVKKFHNQLKRFSKYPTWTLLASLITAKCPSPKIYRPLSDLHTDLQKIDFLGSKELYENLCETIREVFSCAAEAMEQYAEYKKQMGLIDFTDQESEVLKLLQNNEFFREQIRQRVEYIMVDEFQDTSPIQLAIFLKLNELCKSGSFWVGDPKQAIYGFRGTDPELMKACVSKLHSEHTLSHSWRSKTNLVNFSNVIFRQVFDNLPSNEIILDIPEERKTEATGGMIEAWHLTLKGNKSNNWDALAKGVSELLHEGAKPKDIAILLRTNAQCKGLADAFAKWNIPITAETGKLMTTPECALAMAGYRYCLDENDTIALAILLALYDGNEKWPEELRQARDNTTDEKNFLSEIRKKDYLVDLLKRKDEDETPLELLEHVITVLDLERHTRTMQFPEQRLANLDKLRHLCKDYMNQAEANHTTATPSGFLYILNDSNATEASSIGENTVTVMTYHKAKGLEWPIVILGGLDDTPNPKVFGCHIVPSVNFDLEAPLANRELRYWPYPFGPSTPDCLKKKQDESEEQQIETNREMNEARRLFYVGLTRAKDRLIFAINRKQPSKTVLEKNPSEPDKLQTGWLDILSEKLKLDFPMAPGETEWKVNDKTFMLKTTIFNDTEPPEISIIQKAFIDTQVTPTETLPPARRVPSSLHEEDGKATLVATLPPLICRPGSPQDYDQFGNVFHNYIALNPLQNQHEIAARLIANWKMEKYLKPETIIEASEHFYAWLKEQYPEANIATEVPVTYHDDNGTLYQGFIDMLLETPEGFIIIDHKTGGGADAPGLAAKHIAQLRLYKKAVEKVTGKKVLELIIHLPIMEKCYSIE